MANYQYTEDMGEISGFGGGYEQACRDMVLAGLKWLEENPDADPKFQGYKNVFGLILDDNDDAKALTKVMLAACKEGATGAMHHASVSHVMFISKNGWEEYCKKMREREGGNEDG